MIPILLILAFLIAIAAIIFALQNTAAVTVSFFVWQFHQSLALVLILTAIVGVLIGILTVLPGSIRSKWRLANQRKKIDALEKNLQSEKVQREEVQRQLNLLKNPPPPVIPTVVAAPDAIQPPEGQPVTPA